MPEKPRRRIVRRARRPGAPGADPKPQEQTDRARAKDDTGRPAWNDDGNDERLRRDRPPHWG